MRQWREREPIIIERAEGDWLIDVRGSSAKEVYASGGSGVVLRYDGTKWTSIGPAGIGYLYGVAPTAKGPVALGADNKARTYSGGKWIAAPLPTLTTLKDLVPLPKGGLVAVGSFVFLGKSFAILPAIRDVVVRGPYRLVRHPAYLGELLMVLACGLAKPAVLNFTPFLLGIPLIVVRILAEESLLNSSNDYLTYKRKVRFRLIPLVW